MSNGIRIVSSKYLYLLLLIACFMIMNNGRLYRLFYIKIACPFSPLTLWPISYMYMLLMSCLKLKKKLQSIPAYNDIFPYYQFLWKGHIFWWGIFFINLAKMLNLKWCIQIYTTRSLFNEMIGIYIFEFNKQNIIIFIKNNKVSLWVIVLFWCRVIYFHLLIFSPLACSQKI